MQALLFDRYSGAVWPPINALAARRRTPLRRATLARAALLYAERFGLPDGRIPATFEILFLTGWAPEPLNAEYGTGGATGRPTR
jgi:hypothetical protein